jgi:outer membrane receptor protein involved in Fe transport
LEGGARGGAGLFNWNAGFFRATNSDDLLFVASTQTGFGFFKNFGRTERQGIELGATARLPRVMAGVGYSFVDATYQSAETHRGRRQQHEQLRAGRRKRS